MQFNTILHNFFKTVLLQYYTKYCTMVTTADKNHDQPTIKKSKVKSKFRKKDILRMQDMLQNKMQVETVNFRLYFKVIIRQNEIQYFTS